MTSFGKTCPACHRHPAIRTDGLCATCGEELDRRHRRLDELRRAFAAMSAVVRVPR